MAYKKARTDQYSLSLLLNNNFIDKCRLCLKDRKKMLDLFQPERNFVDKIHFCTGIRITENPMLSSSVCRKCDYELTVAHKFKTTCLNTLDVFQTLSNADNDEKFIVKIESISDNEPPILIKTDMNLKYPSDDNIDLDEVIQSIGFGGKSDNSDNNDNNSNDIKYYDDNDMIDENNITNNVKDESEMVEYQYDITYDDSDTDESSVVKYENSIICDGNDADKSNIVKYTNKIIYNDNDKIQNNNDQVNKDVAEGDNDMINDDDMSDDKSDDNKDIIINDGDPDSLLIIKRVKSFEKGEDGNVSERAEMLITERYCAACDKGFESARKLKAHRLVYHSGERHICDICGRSLKHIASFNSHMKKHLTDPRHMCDQCDYKAYTTTDLHKHMRVHTGEKNYICSFCSERFRWPSSLTSHENAMHRKKRSHFCTKCDAAFYTNRTLMMHMDSHDNIKRYECEVCHVWLSRRCHWKTHLKKVHDIDTPKQRRGKPRTY